MTHTRRSLLVSAAAAFAARADQPAELWRFDQTSAIGGHPTTALGHPRVVDKAVEFNGVDDALFVNVHPLAGASVFTWEAIFRPDGGAAEQRWFHLQEQDPQTGKDTNNRLLFEIRVIGDKWCLDAFVNSDAGSMTLLYRDRLHPLAAWYHVAAVYDGRQFRSYVDGVEQGAGDVKFTPHGPGRSSMGVRINKVYYFKGAIRTARFTRRPLPPGEFLKALS